MKSRRAKLLCAATAFLALLAPAGTRAATELDLEGAISAAVRGATVVAKQANNREVAGADLLRAYGNFLPNLQASASFGVTSGKTLAVFNGVAVLDSRYVGAEYRISSSLNLFKGFADAAQLGAATARRDAADLTLARAKEQIALDVAEAYLQVVLDQQLETIAEKNLAASQERLKLFRAREEVGALAPADRYRQEAQAAQDEAALVAARNRTGTDRLSLIQRIRVNAQEDYVLKMPVLPPPNPRGLPAEKDLIDTALRSRPDNLAYGKEYAARAAEVTVARSAYFPALDLAASFNGLGRDYSRANVNGQNRLPTDQAPLFRQLGEFNTTSLQVLLTWDLFSRFETMRNVRVARARENDARFDAEDSANLVVIEVKRALLDLRTALDQFNAAETGVRAADKAYRLIQGRYKLGASSFLDLTTAQAASAQAEGRRAEALVNYQLRERALRVAVGGGDSK